MRVHAIFTLLATLTLNTVSLAQEVGYVDLTDASDYHFSNRIYEKEGVGGGACGGLADIAFPKQVLKVTLLSLDERLIQTNEEVTFSIRLQNVGSGPLLIPFDPNPSDIEPSDPGQAYQYETAQFGVQFKERFGEKRSLDLIGPSLYGSEFDPGSYRELRPGQWVTVVNRGKLQPKDWTTKTLKKTGELDLVAVGSFSTSHETYTPHDPKYQGKPSYFSLCGLYNNLSKEEIDIKITPADNNGIQQEQR